MTEPETPYQRITVDGGEVAIPLSFDAETYNQIAALDGGRPFGDFVTSAIPRMLRRVEKDPKRLRLGFYRLGRAPGFFWLPINFLVMPDGRWQRVFLERLMCSNCQWEGLTTFPLLGDMYIGSRTRGIGLGKPAISLSSIARDVTANCRDTQSGSILPQPKEAGTTMPPVLTLVAAAFFGMLAAKDFPFASSTPWCRPGEVRFRPFPEAGQKIGSDTTKPGTRPGFTTTLSLERSTPRTSHRPCIPPDAPRTGSTRG